VTYSDDQPRDERGRWSSGGGGGSSVGKNTGSGPRAVTRAPVPKISASTGKREIVARTPGGRGLTSDEAYKREVNALKKSDHYGAYMSSNGKTLTTWTGGHLGHITQTSDMNNSMVRRGYTSDKLLHFRATDLHGGTWHGTSPGPGMYARMHRTKGG